MTMCETPAAPDLAEISAVAANTPVIAWSGPTALAFADIVGSSVLIALDQAGTIRRWLALLHGLLAPLAAAEGGRILQAVGDSVVVGFPDLPAATRWALAVQDRTGAQAGHEAADGAPVGAIILRIAVHQGEVMTEDGRIFGHAINVVARLQQCAEPGGIVLSAAAHQAVARLLPRPARDMGLLALRNIAEPMRGFAIDPVLRLFAPALRPGRGMLPSIAVLPFRNVSSDPGWDWFGDGMVEDIILNLASLRELMVIARGTTLLYRGQDPDPRDVGRKLDVGYVLSGTVRRAGTRVRVSAELCDTETGAALWVDRRDVHALELFDLQDEMAARIASGIAPQIRASEIARARRKPPRALTAYDHLLRGLDVINTLDAEVFRSAHDAFAASRAADPSFSVPVAWQARWHSLSVGQGWSRDAAADLRTAGALAGQAITLDPRNSLALATFGHLRSFLFRDYDQGLSYLQQAIDVCPNNATAWALSSASLSYIGKGEQAVRHARQALALSPFDQSRFMLLNYIGLANYSAGDYAEAARWCAMAAAERPNFTANLRILVASFAAAGQAEEAGRQAQRLLALEPGFTLGGYAAGRLPFRDAALREACLGHLASAGIPP